jgi:menaquinone-dependent protoporphyrinogen oxidase
MKILVAYASKHGATTGIAEAIGRRLTELGHVAEVREVDDVADAAPYDAVVLGSAVYAGSWRDDAVAFARRHEAALVTKPVWLFSSGPLGEQVIDEQQQPKQIAALTTALAPKDHRIFFGALDREQLGFGERMLVKAVKAPDGDFRDWDDIRTWADEIAGQLVHA